MKLNGARQQNLVCTDAGEPKITVDNIEVAQFVYLLLHNQKIRDAIDTAHAFGLIAVDDEDVAFGDLVRHTWIALSTALNQLNRSMGRRPLYPFRLAEPVIEKLEFVAQLVALGQ